MRPVSDPLVFLPRSLPICVKDDVARLALPLVCDNPCRPIRDAEEVSELAVSYLWRVPGLTRGQYESALEAVGIGLGSQAPAGVVAHAAGLMDGGWWVLEVWESDDTVQAFYNGPLRCGRL